MSVSRREFWAERMARYRDSSLSVKEFCTREVISQPSFYYWRKKLADEVARTVPTFLPVTVDGEDGPAATIALPGGASMELSRKIDEATLRRILGAVVNVTTRAEAT